MELKADARLLNESKCRGVTMSWQTDEQPPYTPRSLPTFHTPKYTQKVFKTLVLTDGSTDKPMDGPTDGQTKPLVELRVRN